MKKKFAVKFTSILLSSVLLLSISGCTKTKYENNAAEQEYNSKHFERADISLSAMEYDSYDETALLEAIAAMTSLADMTKEAGSASSADIEAYSAAFDAAMTEYDKFVSAYYMVMLNSYRDLSDETAAAEMTRLDELSVDIGDKLAVALGRTIDSPLKNTLVEIHGDKNVLDYEGYTESNAYLNSLLVKEAALEQTYDALSVQKFTSEEDMNTQLGSIIIDLVAIRNEIAHEYGYDNYVDYAFKEVYYRDYTLQDYNTVSSYIRKHLLDAEQTVDELIYYRYNPYHCENVDLESVLKTMSTSIQMPKVVRDALKYMYKYGLYVFTDADSSLDGAFTAKFYAENEPFVYVKLSDTPYDITTFLHETGHFINFFVDDDNAFQSSFGSLEVSETQSQGFALLYSAYVENMYPQYRNLLQINTVGDTLYSLVWVSWRADLEHALYTTEDLTLEKANALAGQLSNDYELNIANDAGDQLTWVSISHIATSPIYQVSYVMSALAAMGLWNESLENAATAQQKYESILMLGSETSYWEMLDDYDLTYVLDEKFFKELSSAIIDKFVTSTNKK